MTPDGKSVRASDGTCAVNKQLVDVVFSSDTRKNFKPGIPFKGKVRRKFTQAVYKVHVNVSDRIVHQTKESSI